MKTHSERQPNKTGIRMFCIDSSFEEASIEHDVQSMVQSRRSMPRFLQSVAEKSQTHFEEHYAAAEHEDRPSQSKAPAKSRAKDCLVLAMLVLGVAVLRVAISVG